MPSDGKTPVTTETKKEKDRGREKEKERIRRGTRDAPKNVSEKGIGADDEILIPDELTPPDLTPPPVFVAGGTGFPPSPVEANMFDAATGLPISDGSTPEGSTPRLTLPVDPRANSNGNSRSFSAALARWYWPTDWARPDSASGRLPRHGGMDGTTTIDHPAQSKNTPVTGIETTHNAAADRGGEPIVVSLVTSRGTDTGEGPHANGGKTNRTNGGFQEAEQIAYPV